MAFQTLWYKNLGIRVCPKTSTPWAPLESPHSPSFPEGLEYKVHVTEVVGRPISTMTGVGGRRWVLLRKRPCRH